MSKNRQTLISLISIVVFMGLASFAAVPFYDWFCRVTGYGGTPSQSRVEAQEILDKSIKVRFDGSKEGSLQWEFKPAQ